ncbi:MAG: glycerate kinase [Collinsella sp.]
MDEQSAAGKAPVGVARRAKRYGKPVVAVVGGRADNLDAVYEQGIDLVLPICRKPMPSTRRSTSGSHNQPHLRRRVCRASLRPRPPLKPISL